MVLAELQQPASLAPAYQTLPSLGARPVPSTHREPAPGARNLA